MSIKIGKIVMLAKADCLPFLIISLISFTSAVSSTGSSPSLLASSILSVAPSSEGSVVLVGSSPASPSEGSGVASSSRINAPETGNAMRAASCWKFPGCSNRDVSVFSPSSVFPFSLVFSPSVLLPFSSVFDSASPLDSDSSAGLFSAFTLSMSTAVYSPKK